MHPAAASLSESGQQLSAHPRGPHAHPAAQRRGITLEQRRQMTGNARSASARSSVTHAHIVTSACGKPPARLTAANSSRSSALAAAGPAGVISLARASRCRWPARRADRR